MSTLLYANHKGLHKDFKAINALAKKATKGEYLISFEKDNIKVLVLEKDSSFFAVITLVPSKFKTIFSLGIIGTFTINATEMTDILTNISTTSLLFAHDEKALYFNNNVIDMEKSFSNITVPKLEKAIDIVKFYNGVLVLEEIDMSILDAVLSSKTQTFVVHKLSDSLNIILSKAMVPYDLSSSLGNVYTNGSGTGLLVIEIETDSYFATQYIKFIPF